MADPKLMLIDEMSLGLAPIVIDELFRALKEIGERGITIVFVEQNVRRTLGEAIWAYILRPDMWSGAALLQDSGRKIRLKKHTLE